MPAGSYDLVIEQSRTFRLSLNVSGAGQPINWDGYGARFVVKRLVNEGPAFTLSTQDGGITMDDRGGIKIRATPSQTSALSWATGLYELVIVAPGGDETSLLKGKVTVSAAVA